MRLFTNLANRAEQSLCKRKPHHDVSHDVSTSFSAFAIRMGSLCLCLCLCQRGVFARGEPLPLALRACLDDSIMHAGPASSFLVISDPAAAKHVLRASDNPKNPIYDKGLVAEVCPLFLRLSAGMYTCLHALQDCACLLAHQGHTCAHTQP